jgi:multidrug resistance efflux pump
MQFEVDRRTVRAPISGRIGEAQILRVGSYIRSGEPIGAIVPLGALRIVAEFPPLVIGRIRIGQPAELRLQGFPWAEYGSIQARVSAVAEEIRNDRVRVELSITPRPVSRVPLQHGLPGSVQVEVERVTPARLVLRAAGQLVASVGNETGGAHP